MILTELFSFEDAEGFAHILALRRQPNAYVESPSSILYGIELRARLMFAVVVGSEGGTQLIGC